MTIPKTDSPRHNHCARCGRTMFQDSCWNCFDKFGTGRSIAQRKKVAKNSRHPRKPSKGFISVKD